MLLLCAFNALLFTNHVTAQTVIPLYEGKAPGSEIWNLAMEIQQSVKEKFGIEILPEVNVV